MPTLVIRKVEPDDQVLISILVRLADANRRTLGFLPEQAIRERAVSGQALVALYGEDLAGYALFDLPRDDVRLIHLCVAASHRGKGVARALVRALSEEQSTRRGIVVRCRRDWPANEMWPTLGFAPRRDVPGRGQDQKPLTVWWLDFGQPDLFTGSEDVDRLVVALDTNVFNDLHAGLARSGGEESEILRAPWVEAEIEIVVTTTLINELNRTDDARVRQKLVQAANDYPSLRSRPDVTAAHAAALLDGLDRLVLESDPSLTEDAHLIAASGVGGADVYLTRDAPAIRELAWRAADQLGIQVLRPSDLAIHLDKVRDSARLAERRLHESRVKLQVWPVGSADHLAAMINTEAGETRGAFNAHVRRMASEASPARSRIVIDDDGQPVAALAMEMQGATLNVPLARVAKGQALTKAVAGQIPLLLRREALARRASRIDVSDPHAQRVVIEALVSDGFDVDEEGRLCASPIAQVLSSSAFLSATGLRNSPAGVRRAWADLEHEFWPLKLSDADAHCYLVPIRPAFASRLFGTDLTLFDRDPQLALAREHVYYHAPRRRLSAPARILWYVSSPDKEVVGCSQIVSVHVDTPEILHERFRHLGVWDLETVDASARGNLVGAVRFRDTQLFTHRVSLASLRKLAPGGDLEPLPSARLVAPQRFFDVYVEGQGEM